MGAGTDRENARNRYPTAGCRESHAAPDETAGVATHPNKDGVGRSVSPCVVEGGSLVLYEKATQAEDPADLFTASARAIEAGDTVAFLDETDDLATNIVFGSKFVQELLGDGRTSSAQKEAFTCRWGS